MFSGNSNHYLIMKLPLLLLCIVYFSNAARAQDDPCKYSRYSPPADTISMILKKKKNQLIYDNAISFRALSNQSAANSLIAKMQVSSTINFIYRNTGKRFTNELSLFDETSFQMIPDSTFENQKDLSRLKWSIQPAAADNSNWKQTSSVVVQTQKLPVRKAITGSTPEEKRLESAFLSPGIVLLSIGITRGLANNGKIECGFAGGKLTWIDQKKIYQTNDVQIISGVGKGKPFLIEGGVSMQASMKKNLNKFLRWENTTLVFADISAVNQPDVEFRNGFFWDHGKLFRTTLQTVYTYNRKRWPPSNWTGELALGFYLASN